MNSPDTGRTTMLSAGATSVILILLVVEVGCKHMWVDHNSSLAQKVCAWEELSSLFYGTKMTMRQRDIQRWIDSRAWYHLNSQ